MLSKVTRFFKYLLRISKKVIKRIFGWRDGIGPSSNKTLVASIVGTLLWLTITNSTWIYHKDFLTWSLGSAAFMKASKGAVDTYQQKVKGGRRND